MLGKIQDELAKMIATEIYAFGKEKAGQVQAALKDTTLRTSGAGLPPPLLVSFHESFLEALKSRYASRDGYARFAHGTEEHEFKLLRRAPLVVRIQKTDWCKAANQTKEGVDQIRALGGPSEYQEAVSKSVERVFDYTVSKYVGVFHTYGWRVLSEVVNKPAARVRTTQFQDTHFFYWSTGSEEQTGTEYKLAKKLLTTGSMWWKKCAQTSAGPFLDA